MDLLMCMELNVVNNFNHIVAMETSTKPNFSLCMDEHLTILKNICDRHVTLTNKNLVIYGAYLNKTYFHIFTRQLLYHYWLKVYTGEIYLNHYGLNKN